MMTRPLWLGACLAFFLLTACGGGDEHQAKGGVGTGGTGSYAAGSISAFGSIVVNGIHYEPTHASIRHVDQPSQALSPSALKLGMVVEVNGLAIQSRQGLLLSEADTIRISSQLVGTVDQVTANQLHMLGQTVLVSSSTHFDDALPLGLGSLGTGQQVEVHGFFDAGNNTYRASRIDLKPTPLTYHVVEGVVADLDTGNRTCRVGARFYALPTIPAGVANGKVARLQILPGQHGTSGNTSSSPMSASAITPTKATVQDGPRTAYLDGLVTAVADGSGQRFSLGQLDIDATGIACPVCASLQPGDKVRVSGPLNQTTVTATEVQASN